MGYRYYEKENVKPAFPFGYGLSYTNFEINNIRINKVNEIDENILVKINATVVNTGKFAGAEVVQCYVSDCEASVPRPVKELKAYKKVYLNVGEQKDIELELPYMAFAFYNVDKHSFVVEKGKFEIWLGNSSECCRVVDTVNIEDF